MDDKGKIISSYDMDDTLALQIWTKGHAPRLVIFNKIKNTKKLIRLGWVEKRDRKLSMNGPKRGETVNYSVQDFEPGVQRILIEYAARTNFRVKLLKFALDLQKVLHSPELVTDRKEMALMSEDKRSSLWIADCTGEDKKTGFFRPFFPVTRSEAEGLTEDKLRITGGGRSSEVLIKSGVVAGLEKANPARWHNPLRVAAAGMLLSFSFCDADGSKFTESLWDEKKPVATSSVTGSTMRQPTRAATGFSLHNAGLVGMGHKLAAYIRHFYAAGQIHVGESLDSEKDLQGAGYTRTRRVDFQEGALGDVAYRVTFYENAEEGRIALSCIPQSVTSRHKGELIYVMPAARYQAAIKQDTMGGPEDEFYTITQLVRARQFKEWYDNVAPYVRAFSGLIE